MEDNDVEALTAQGGDDRTVTRPLRKAQATLVFEEVGSFIDQSQQICMCSRAITRTRTESRNPIGRFETALGDSVRDDLQQILLRGLPGASFRRRARKGWISRPPRGTAAGFDKGQGNFALPLAVSGYSLGSGEKCALTIFHWDPRLASTMVVRPHWTLGAPPPLGVVASRSYELITAAVSVMAR